MPNVKRNFSVPGWLLAGVIAGIIIKLFVLDFLHVNGISMEKTIHNGSVILVNKLAYGIVKPLGSELFVQWADPQVDDIVIYLHDNKIVVKRCVAVGKTNLDYLADSEYSLIVNGKKIHLSAQQYANMKGISSVPDGYILALGDNYDNSIDSRTYGFVPVKNVLGRVLCR